MRKLLAILSIVMMAMMIVSCSGEEKEGNAAAPAEEGQRDDLVIAISTEPTTLRPASTALVYDEVVINQLYGRLLYHDMDMKVHPYLAESWEKIDDTHYKFILKDGLKFSDGSDVKSEDVAASLQAVHDNPASQSYADWYDSTEIIDDRTFIINLSAPSATFFDNLAIKCHIAPKALLEGDHDFNSAPVGSGPYKLVSWEQGESITLTENEYFNVEGFEAHIPDITIRIIPEGVTRTIALERGEVDYIWDVQASDLPELEQEEGVTIYTSPSCTPVFLCINYDRIPDVNIRKAIGYGINRANIVMITSGNYATELTSSFPMNLLGSTDENACYYDPEIAREYLRKAGVEEGERLSMTAEKVDDDKPMAKANKVMLGLILGAEVCWFMADNAVNTFFSLFVQYYLNCSTSSSSLLTILGGVFSVLGFWFGGVIADRIGRKWTISIGLGLYIAGAILMCFAWPTEGADGAYVLPWILYLVFPIKGFGIALVNTCSFPMVVELCSSKKVGKFTSYYYAASMGAQAVTSIALGGLLYLTKSYSTLPIYATCFMAAAFLIFLFVRNIKAKVVRTKRGLEALDQD